MKDVENSNRVVQVTEYFVELFCAVLDVVAVEWQLCVVLCCASATTDPLCF
jgi:hypothetical protein